jgi:hypothetical protein
VARLSGSELAAEFVIDACHRLFQIERPSACGKRPAGRPVYHRKHDFIESRLTTVFAPHQQPLDWGPRRMVHQEAVRTARRYRTIEIQAGASTVTVGPPNDLREAFIGIHRPGGVH